MPSVNLLDLRPCTPCGIRGCRYYNHYNTGNSGRRKTDPLQGRKELGETNQLLHNNMMVGEVNWIIFARLFVV